MCLCMCALFIFVKATVPKFYNVIPLALNQEVSAAEVFPVILSVSETPPPVSLNAPLAVGKNWGFHKHPLFQGILGAFMNTPQF